MVNSFFGYGSLVNAATHDYPNTRPATLRGWRRTWVQSSSRDIAFLSVKAEASGFEGTAMFQAKPSSMAPLGGGQPILLSYLDCVVQGFNTVYGTDGVRDFFRSTSGWDTPILNDRSAPVYPRAQMLSSMETKLTDDHIAMVGAQVIASA
jgi:hypothetical protein